MLILSTYLVGYEMKKINKLKRNKSKKNNINHSVKTCSGNCNSCEYSQNIKNKRVLYVGGINSTIVKCKKMIEDNGGIFEHHDGGVENSKTKLTKMLIRADLIFCPVKNVSHGATYAIKKICKQHKKNLIFLRSSGFSFFARELMELQLAA